MELWRLWYSVDIDAMSSARRYGIILEKMQEQGHFLEKIAGCVVDSAPVADPDPQVLLLMTPSPLVSCCFLSTCSGEVIPSSCEAFARFGFADLEHCTVGNAIADVPVPGMFE